MRHRRVFSNIYGLDVSRRARFASLKQELLELEQEHKPAATVEDEAVGYHGKDRETILSMKIQGSLVQSVICGLLVLSAVSGMLASTGRSHEISNIRFENVTQTSVDVLWETAHPSTSQVLEARSNEFEIERRIPAVPGTALVMSHRVRVDHLFPDWSYYIYVVSVDQHGTMSTAPGPQTPDGKNPLMLMRTAPTDPAGPPDFKVYTLGPNEVFAGHDLYFLAQLAVVAGPANAFYVHNQHGYNNGSDGVVKSADAGHGNPESISVHFACAWENPSANDSAEQTLDPQRKLGFCDKGVNKLADMSFRLRTTPQTIPGKYSVSFTVENNGVKRTGSYDFNVLAPPAAPPTPQLTEKAIPGLSTWEKQMVALGEKWCSYRDQQNAQGNWVIAWGWTGDAWFYDGGRSYQNIDSYTAAAGHPNHAHWQHCALSLLEPYASYLTANNGAMATYAVFPSGMAMNYWRTDAQLMRDGVKVLAEAGPRHVGFIDPAGIRENSYRCNAWMMNEMLGAPRSPMLQRNIDKIMGQLNMIANGEGGPAHPFMAGIGMETLIRWYDLSLADGHPDYRVLPVIKEALDGVWRDSWAPKENLFLYDHYELPPSQNLAHSALNNMVSVAYAWYWLQTGDTTERDRGDLAFQHALDVLDAYVYTGKQFSQLYEFSFDFVRYRKGEKTSDDAPENNPYTGPYADSVPPIMEKTNCDPNFFPGCKAGTITSTTATIFWNTYKPATSQVGYGTNANSLRGTPIDKSLVLAHSVTISGLQPATTYHFRVRSVDKSGLEATMRDLTFTTLPAAASAK